MKSYKRKQGIVQNESTKDYWFKFKAIRIMFFFFLFIQDFAYATCPKVHSCNLSLVNLLDCEHHRNYVTESYFTFTFSATCVRIF